MDLRIRETRLIKGMTQQQISEYLICDQSLYSKYERGEREVPLKSMVKLATLFETSLDYLVGLTDDKQPNRQTENKNRL